MLNIPLSQAQKFAVKIAKSLKGGEILALSGELGSGKTTFTKSLGKALGITQTITSPTFVMMQEYQIPRKASGKKFGWLYHLDLYRTDNFSEVKALGITEFWAKPETITVIEWADKIAKDLPKEAIVLNFYRDTD